jgi:SAM-dependent methyltransferase
MSTRLDSRERFSAAANDYARYRPSYPPEAIDWILATTGVASGARIADVGCGTGIATRLFAERGFDVIGIDPNEEMLGHARQAGGATYLRGESTATGLPDASVDLVVSAQAFHWFEIDPTLVELRRVLRGSRWAAAFWNSRTPSPEMDAYDAILVEHSTEYEKDVRDDPRAGLRRAEKVIDPREAEFPGVEGLTWEQLWGRARSSSYVVHGVVGPRMLELEDSLRRLFERHARSGKLAWHSTTKIRSFRVAAS